jgi:pyridoxal phosphate enzyme (YggS family)
VNGLDKYSYISKNVARIRERIDKAAIAAGRDPSEITLLAAIKYADTEEIEYLQTVEGVGVLGENRVQQLLERYDVIDRESKEMHFIGTLQTNKVKYIVDKVDMIHSLDSEKLAAEIDKQCKKIGKIMNVLCEINCGREEMKSGLMPEDVEEFCMSLEKYTNLKLCGFMTMAPKCEKNDEYIKYFSETTHLVLDIWHKKLDNIYKPVLSMGMSDSFEAAIAAGSTIVRVGRGLFVKE